MFSQLLKEVKCGIVWIIELNNFVNMRMHAIPRQTHFNSMLNKPCQNVTIEPKLIDQSCRVRTLAYQAVHRLSFKYLLLCDSMKP